MNGTHASNDGVEQVVVYLRISEDRTGAEAGVKRQRQDCLELCARLGISDPAIFMDNDISAYSGKNRPGSPWWGGPADARPAPSTGP